MPHVILRLPVVKARTGLSRSDASITQWIEPQIAASGQGLRSACSARRRSGIANCPPAALACKGWCVLLAQPVRALSRRSSSRPDSSRFVQSSIGRTGAIAAAASCLMM